NRWRRCDSTMAQSLPLPDSTVHRSKRMGMTIVASGRRLHSFGRGMAAHLPNRYSLPHNVNVQEPSALAYWCRHFDTSAERLLAAVKKVGTNPAIVSLELRVRQPA